MQNFGFLGTRRPEPSSGSQAAPAAICESVSVDDPRAHGQESAGVGYTGGKTATPATPSRDASRMMSRTGRSDRGWETHSNILRVTYGLGKSTIFKNTCGFGWRSIDFQCRTVCQI